MKLTNEQLDEILQQAGLRLAQPYNANGKYRKAEWLYTSCIDCETEAHYRLKYILDKKRYSKASLQSLLLDGLVRMSRQHL